MRILVVEDEPDLRSAVCQALREAEFAVDEASDGLEGASKAKTWDYDAIVLDIMMPGLECWQVLQEVRRKKTTPVLILSARDAISDRVRGLDGGADDYLPKPFSILELISRLRALIRTDIRACRLRYRNRFDCDQPSRSNRLQRGRTDRLNGSRICLGGIAGTASRQVDHPHQNL